MKININNIKISIIFLFVLLIAFACEKETEYNVLSGKIIGYVSLTDCQGKSPSDKSGVEILLEGSNPATRTFSDVNGKFIIDDLKSGIYNIVFNKEGYGQHKIIAYQFVGGNKPTTLYSTNLYELSNILIDSLELSESEEYFNVDLLITAKLTRQNENYTRSFRYYLSNTPDVSYKNYISTSSFYSYYDELLFLQSRIDTVKFPVGSELFMIVYPSSGNYQCYIDVNSGKAIYSSITIENASNVVSIIVPEVKYPEWYK